MTYLFNRDKTKVLKSENLKYEITNLVETDQNYIYMVLNLPEKYNNDIQLVLTKYDIKENKYKMEVLYKSKNKVKYIKFLSYQNKLEENILSGTLLIVFENQTIIFTVENMCIYKRKKIKHPCRYGLVDIHNINNAKDFFTHLINCELMDIKNFKDLLKRFKSFQLLLFGDQEIDKTLNFHLICH